MAEKEGESPFPRALTSALSGTPPSLCALFPILRPLQSPLSLAPLLGPSPKLSEAFST